MKKLILASIIFASVGLASANAETLYQELGGYDAISAVTKTLATKLVQDPKLGVYFKGLNTHHKEVLINNLTDFLCNATGGPCIYTGENMEEAHAGLGITDSDWNRFVKITEGVLNEYRVPPKLQKELLERLVPLKPYIVQKQSY
ncbi:group I truncated hemoglobin [Hydrogenobaculum acidophilum]